MGGFDADGSHREGGRDAWKQLVRANSFESRGGGLNWPSPLLLVLLCSGEGEGQYSQYYLHFLFGLC